MSIDASVRGARHATLLRLASLVALVSLIGLARYVERSNFSPCP